MQTPYDAQIRTHAVAVGVDPSLMQAIVAQESGGHPYAHRMEPGYLTNQVVMRQAEAWARKWQGTPNGLTERTDRASSWGLGQIMGQVAREHGFAERYLPALVEVETNLLWMARLLADWGRRATTDEHLICMWNGGKGIVWPLAAGRDDLRGYLAKVERFRGESPYVLGEGAG